MSESEQKRKRLLDRIERWCEHTNHRNLRNGDIAGLVSWIIEEFYPVSLCCHHNVSNIDEGISLTFKDYSDGELCDISGTYCKDCAEEYKRDLGAKEV